MQFKSNSNIFLSIQVDTLYNNYIVENNVNDYFGENEQAKRKKTIINEVKMRNV